MSHVLGFRVAPPHQAFKWPFLLTSGLRPTSDMAKLVTQREEKQQQSSGSNFRSSNKRGGLEVQRAAGAKQGAERRRRVEAKRLYAQICGGVSYGCQTCRVKGLSYLRPVSCTTVSQTEEPASCKSCSYRAEILGTLKLASATCGSGYCCHSKLLEVKDYNSCQEPRLLMLKTQSDNAPVSLWLELE